MEMSLAYMEETAGLFEAKGYSVERGEQPYGDDVIGHRFRIRRAGTELVLETVQHPEVGETYYLEIVDHHGLRCYSFALDSWKHRDHQVEFKYQPQADGTGGLAFILTFPD